MASILFFISLSRNKKSNLYSKSNSKLNFLGFIIIFPIYQQSIALFFFLSGDLFQIYSQIHLSPLDLIPKPVKVSNHRISAEVSSKITTTPSTFSLSISIPWSLNLLGKLRFSLSLEVLDPSLRRSNNHISVKRTFVLSNVVLALILFTSIFCRLVFCTKDSRWFWEPWPINLVNLCV